MTDNCVVLCVAEKPSLAAAIAGFLSDGQHVTRKGGATDVHELQRRFHGRPAKFKVTSVKGHVFNLDFEQAYNSWDRPPRDLFFKAGTEKVPTSGAVCGHIRQEAAGCEHLVLFLDCDREGENICFEVMHIALPAMRRAPPGQQRVWRAFFSAVSAASISAAMSDLREPNQDEASAVDARQELDLKVGVAFTRFLTHHCNDHFKRLGSSTVSFGPCQTPTLGFVVRRHLESLAFVPEPFWSVGLSLAPPARGGEGGSAATPLLEERRIDITDGGAYTQSDFVEFYGGLVEWGMAKIAIPEGAAGRAAGGTAATTSARLPGESTAGALADEAGAPLEVHWQRVRVFDCGVASVCLGMVRASSDAALKSLTDSIETRSRPLGLNTVTMLKTCSKALGMGAERAMKVAESLCNSVQGLKHWTRCARQRTSTSELAH